ncbi:salicylate synthase [Actinoalloteichus hymeniacidonis]|uniref:Salicylate synthase n=1 Tax=Actinoalloteichus hymeniacidonis TaxID=340345 RepID=A0AAC9HQL1_9PSEU|nr:salicylate synthase [Actinoalloteichus hymeniacidonis]AOS63694.1 salicylate synthase [Actinoalloteichus hymeniacidonis]MBB5908253.1 salicylate synthetase [Actinoalloteichus hymeniacidonis]
MTHHIQDVVETSLDPVALTAGLARSGLFSEYVGYERNDEWTFAGGVLSSIALDSDRITIHHAGGEPVSHAYRGHPGQALRNALDSLGYPEWRAYGWVGFDFASAVHIDPPAPEAPPRRLARLMIPRTEVRCTPAGTTVEGMDIAATERVLAELSQLRATPATSGNGGGSVNAEADAASYRARVRTAIEEIRRGLYQKVILSRVVRLPFSVDFPATYVAGRRGNSPARSFLLDLDGVRCAGFSPELVVTVDEQRNVVTNPLAGTRAFGPDDARNATARADLESDPKEIYEHAVSVRAALTEMNSVCDPNSTSVSDFMSVSERGSVQHLASTVRGRLAPGNSAWDAFSVLFPAITASGIPKPDSLDAILRLDEPRGLYSGAIVTASSAGDLDAALVLRAVYQEDGQAWLRAGAGIVAGSTPDREFEETREKLDSVLPFLVPA